MLVIMSYKILKFKSVTIVGKKLKIKQLYIFLSMTIGQMIGSENLGKSGLKITINKNIELYPLEYPLHLLRTLLLTVAHLSHVQIVQEEGASK